MVLYTMLEILTYRVILHVLEGGGKIGMTNHQCGIG